MKIRTGFVSNSSSSSFCIFGTFFTQKDLLEYFDIPADTENIIDDFEKLGLPYCTGPEYDDGGVYVGRSVMDCKDDQTMGDFKKQIMDEINAKLKKPLTTKSYSFISEAWYDG